MSGQIEYADALEWLARQERGSATERTPGNDP